MKKILLFLILTFCVSNVMALEYTDYSEFSEFSEEVIKEDDLTDVKSERRYKYYKLNKILGPYVESPNEKYLYLDDEDYIYTNYSEVSPIKPEDKEGRIIEEVGGYKYKRVKDINYITISAWMSYINLANVEVLYKGEKLDYEVECNEKADGFNLRINGSVTLKLPYNVDISNIEVCFDIVSAEYDVTQYVINAGHDSDSHIWTQNLFEYFGENSQVWKGNTAVSSMYAWEEFYSLEKLDTSRVLKLLEESMLYQYKDILYRSYALGKEYYPNYLTGPIDDYIYKDENLYKDYYAKRVRSIIPGKMIDEVVTSEVNREAESQALSIPLRNANSSLVLEDNSTEIIKAEKTPYYKLEVPKMEGQVEVSKWEILYVLFPFILILVILILVLSKLYKNKKACDTL